MKNLFMENVNIVTHDGTFHADEITAVALLMIFLNKENEDINITTNRVDHNSTDFEECDYVIDVGRKWDKVKYFDHHQWQGGMSSAGLIWMHIKEKFNIASDRYTNINRLVCMVDKHDVGDEKAEEFEYPSLIAKMNNKDKNEEIQMDAFISALGFACKIIESMVEDDDMALLAEEKIKECIEILPGVWKMPEYIDNWNKFINGYSTPNVNMVTWEDKVKGVWKLQMVPKEPGSFEFNGEPLVEYKSVTMQFVHKTGFLAVAPDYATLKQYIKIRRMVNK